MNGATRSSPYIYEKYSAKRTALAASVVTYRGRSALREVAKAMGLSDDVRGGAVGVDLGLVFVRRSASRKPRPAGSTRPIR